MSPFDVAFSLGGVYVHYVNTCGVFQPSPLLGLISIKFMIKDDVFGNAYFCEKKSSYAWVSTHGQPDSNYGCGCSLAGKRTSKKETFNYLMP